MWAFLVRTLHVLSSVFERLRFGTGHVILSVADAAILRFVIFFSAPEGPPVNVHARPVSQSTVVVRWEEPEVPNGIIKVFKYLVLVVLL